MLDTLDLRIGGTDLRLRYENQELEIEISDKYGYDEVIVQLPQVEEIHEFLTEILNEVNQDD